MQELPEANQQQQLVPRTGTPLPAALPTVCLWPAGGRGFPRSHGWGQWPPHSLSRGCKGGKPFPPETNLRGVSAKSSDVRGHSATA